MPRLPSRVGTHARKNGPRGPTAVDLFSGCGGLTLGLKQAGFRVLGAVEIDPVAAETYRLNHPEVALWQADISKLPARRILRDLGLRRGELDLLAGCPPCQGFSAIRTRNGKRRVRDGRNDLIYRFLDLVRELRPRAVMLENVPGLLDNRRMAEFRRELVSLGYDLGDSPVVLNTARYGVPQRRRRLILLAGRHGPIPFAPPSPTVTTVRAALGSLAPCGLSGDPLHDYPQRRSPLIAGRIAAVPRDGGSRTDLPAKYRLACHATCQGFRDVYGRMKWDDVAPTITGGCASPSKGRFLHPEEDRCISLREAALLQSFPGDYRFSLRGGKTAVALMIGNALPPEFIRRHAEQVHRQLSGW